MQSQKPAVELTPLDQLTPQGYIRQIYCYPVSGSDVVRKFKDGLAGLLEDVPYLRSGIVKTHDPGVPVRLSDPYQSINEIFSSADLSETLNYDSLREVNFSPHSLTGKEIEPQLPEEPSESMPVLRTKVTLLHGGSTWLDRTPLLKLSPKAPNPPPERPQNQAPKKTPRPKNDTTNQKEEFETAVFRFSSKTLQELKALVNAYVPSIGVPWVSTSDVLIALLWSAATGAEAQVEKSDTGLPWKPTVTVALLVNIRHRLNPRLPKEYIGAAYGTVAATALREDLLSVAQNVDIKSLATIAAAVRTSYGTVTHDSIREKAGLIQACPDLSKVKWGPSFDGVVIVSWADQGIYELDWGRVIGKCEAVRFQEFGFRAYPYILPRLSAKNSDSVGGDYEFILSLERKAMKLFREGHIMSDFATAGLLKT